MWFLTFDILSHEVFTHLPLPNCSHGSSCATKQQASWIIPSTVQCYTTVLYTGTDVRSMRGTTGLELGDNGLHKHHADELPFICSFEFSSILDSRCAMEAWTGDWCSIWSRFVSAVRLHLILQCHPAKGKLGAQAECSSYRSFYYGVYNQYKSFICLDLIIKNRKILIKMYFKWWTATKLVWTRYQNY
jgi:hypothetical protein